MIVVYANLLCPKRIHAYRTGVILLLQKLVPDRCRNAVSVKPFHAATAPLAVDGQTIETNFPAIKIRLRLPLLTRGTPLPAILVPHPGFAIWPSLDGRLPSIRILLATVLTSYSILAVAAPGEMLNPFSQITSVTKSFGGFDVVTRDVHHGLALDHAP